MITKRHVAILQAALKFFDEEFFPHGESVVKHYFDRPLRPKLKPVEVRELRKFLDTCQLRYAVGDVNSTSLLGMTCIANPKKIDSTLLGSSQGIATILFPKTS